MSSLSVPPRFLSLMREPKFNSDDPADMVLALRTLDKAGRCLIVAVLSFLMFVFSRLSH
jgi:hypothetical protein